MRKTNKLISILLSIFMLIQLTATIALAATELPASAEWSTTKAGYINFPATSGIEYNYILYKDGDEVMWASHETDTTSTISEDVRVRLLKNGAGTYSFKFVTYDEDDEIASEGATGSYIYSPVSNPVKAPAPQNPVYADNKITWTQDTTNVDAYTVNFYVVTADTNYFLTENAYYGSTPSINVYDWLFNLYNQKITSSGLDASTTSLVAEIAAVPTDIINYTLSDYSNTVVISGNAESTPPITGEQIVAQGSCGDSATWKLDADGVLTISGTGSVTDASGYMEYQNDILKLVIAKGINKIDSDMFYELYNLEDVTIADTVTSIGSGFLKGSAVSYVTFPASVAYIGEWFGVKCASLVGITVYNPECVFEYDEYATMDSSVRIFGYTGSTMEQYATTIGNDFASIDPDFSINESREETVETNSGTVTIEFDSYALNDFTQYKILDGEFKNISDIEDGKITYTLDSKDGLQDIEITFKNNYIQRTALKSVIYNNKHKVTYKVNGEIFKEVTVGCGNEIPEMTEIPSVSGYRFDGWETTPEIMPDEDIVINAKMTKVSTVTGTVKSGDAPLSGAEILIDNTVAATTGEDGTFSLELIPDEYMATVKSGTMTKSVAIDATGSSLDLGIIVLSAASSSVEITEEAVKLVDGVDAILTEEDIAYTQTPGNTVSVNVSIASVSENASITEALSTTYGLYSPGIMLDIDISKVKTGTESSTVPVTETNSLVSVKFEIPSEFLGKDEYIVLREHDGTVDALSATANENGEYIVVEDNTITIYANKFSTYALVGKVIVSSSSSGGGSSKVSVKFEVNGGSKIAAISVARNSVVSEPEAPVKEGFVFGGWYTDKALTKEFDFSTKLTRATTLYAKWDEKADDALTIVLTIGETDVLVNDETKANDVAPIIVNERTMLPIRFIAEELGATVGWDEVTRTVTVKFEEKEIIIVIGESTASVNGEAIELDAPAFIENSRTYLPIRFLMENLGADVQWDGENQKVTIIK